MLKYIRTFRRHRQNTLLTLLYFSAAFCITETAYGGWFGYSDQEECWDLEPGRLMSRMFNPLPKKAAYDAARAVCDAYPTKYQKKLKAMSMGELQQERERAEAYDAERKRRSKAEGIADFTAPRVRDVDAEIRLRSEE